MWKCLLVVLLVVVVRPGLGQDLTTGVQPPATVAQPASALPGAEPCIGTVTGALPAAPAYAAAVQSDHAAPDEFALQTKAEHLRLAAAHLEAAGLKEEAQRVRQRAAKEPSHTTVAARQPILVELRMLELPWTKLDKLSSERYGGSKGMSVMELLSKLQSACADPRSPTFSASLDPNKLLSLIEALRKDHLVEPLAEPSLVVVPGRSASVFVGGELGYSWKDPQGKEVTMFKEYGTRADVVALLVSGDRIHLDLRLRKSELDEAHSTQVGDQKVPALKTREIETGVDVHSGQTVALVGAVEQRMPVVASPPGAAGNKPDAGSAPGRARTDVEEFQTLVLVKAEIVTKSIADAAAAKPAARR